MAETLLTLSDGEGAPLMTRDNFVRAVRNGYTYLGQWNEKALTLHVP